MAEEEDKKDSPSSEVANPFAPQTSSDDDDDDDEPTLDVNSCLPFRLEDLCWVTIINELESYPVELLAILPRHMRNRLLSNIPKYDLNRLERTPIAQGINTEELWKTAVNSPFINRVYSFETDEDFLLATPFVAFDDLQLANLYKDDLESTVVAATKGRSPKELYFLILFWSIIRSISEEQPELERDIDYPEDIVYVDAFDGLAAVRSYEFLVQLPGATKWKELPGLREWEKDDRKFDEYESGTLDSYRQMWRKQATPLARWKRYDMGVGYDTHLLLIPQRLLSIHQSSSPIELLNHLVIGCGIQPLNLIIDANILYTADSNLKTCYSASAVDESYHHFLKTFFSKVIILELIHIYPENVDSLRFVFESIVSDGTDSSLKVLELSASEDFPNTKLDLSFLLTCLCTLPGDPPSLPHYQGLSLLKIGSPPEPSSYPYLAALLDQQHSLNHVYVQLLDSCQDHYMCESDLKLSVSETELSALATMMCDALCLFVNRKEFQSLTIGFSCQTFSPRKDNCCNLFPFTKLLHSFMISPCASKQSLHFESTRGSPLKGLTPLVYSSSEDKVPPNCGTEHKLLSYVHQDVHVIVPCLIQLPIIQLQEFTFNFEKGAEWLFSQLAHHPNLNVTNLQIKFGKMNDPWTLDPQEIQPLFSTLCQDFERIFQMPSLKTFRLSGVWLCYSEIKKALVVGIHQQAQVCSLQKLCLDHNCSEYRPEIDYKYSESELKELWSAIFTLPQVHRLEFELAAEFSTSVEFIDMIDIICECWKLFSHEKKKLKSIQLFLHEDYNFDEIWGSGKLDPFKTVTHGLDIMLDYYRHSPELMSYF